MKYTPDEINQKIELLVFGDDLKTRADEHAIRAFWQHYAPNYTCDGTKYTTYVQWGGNGRNIDIPAPIVSGTVLGIAEPIAKYIWEHRHGQPWQKDLESHVAAYRRPARDFYHSWELMGVLLNKLSEQQIQMTSLKEGWGVMIDEVDVVAKELPAAVALAALSALEKGTP